MNAPNERSTGRKAEVPSHASVLIVGGGPTGMTLALALHRNGVKPVLIDGKSGTRKYSQALTVWPRALDIFDKLGVIDGLRPLAIPWRGFIFNLEGHLRDGFLCRRPFSRERFDARFGRIYSGGRC